MRLSLTYEACQPRLGARLREEVEQATASIQRNPSAFSPIEGTPCRMLILSQFHYSLVYHELDDRIRIIAVAHHRYRPGYWRKHLPN